MSERRVGGIARSVQSDPLQPSVAIYRGSPKPVVLLAAHGEHGVPFFFSTGYSNLATKEGYSDRHVLKKPFQRDGVEASFRHVLSVAHEQ